MYQVLARKWRPQIFEDLVGQQTVTQTLQNAIASGRIAHAFLFSGPRGVGKTTCARILAKALNCQSSPGPVTKPCNVCASCTDIANSRSLDVLEIDGASNRGIDEVRELRESAKYQPMRDRFRIFIIDEVHMLTAEAFNALLKILEEPPAHVFFIFATTEFIKVPATILSRCQLHDFKRIPDRVLTQRLGHITKEEGVTISEGALQKIASASEGGLRDALSALDQIISFSGQKIADKDVETVLGLVDSSVMLDLGQAIAKGDPSAVLPVLDRIAEYGIDYKVFYNELLSFYRNLFLIRFSGANSEAGNEQLRQLASQYEEIHLLRICHQLVSIQSLLRLSGNLRFVFEVTLVRLAQIKNMVPLEELAETFKKNPSALGGSGSGSFPTPGVRPTVAPARVSPPPDSPVPTATNRTPASPDPSKPAIPISDDLLATLIEELEARNPRMAAALEGARYRRDSKAIRFYVPETLYRIVEQDPKGKTDLQSLLSEKLGAALEVEFFRGDPPPEDQAVAVATPETIVKNDPAVQGFLKTFQGKISKIELNKERNP
ncbi:MAG TPA: DNA polymerase III subunit gamma/tau [Acidobacteriota bacterium]|nr:DNA polymerase III subunit gamma/tau [Acidobacteriota bacterium]